jgi:hypothetical protein
MRLKTEIADMIRNVNSMECETLLEMRYLTFLAWDQIASQLNYSQDYIVHRTDLLSAMPTITEASLRVISASAFSRTGL